MANQSGPLLVLLGFMGAGKSTIGWMLAAKLGCPFIDLDAVITQNHGPIPELFESHGESGFRAIEHDQLDRLLPTLARPAVLALGGGAFLQPANRELLELHSATTIFLDAPFELIRTRVSGSGHQRPLARDPDQLHRLYEQRRPAYLLAQHTLAITGNDPSGLLSELLQLCIRLGASPSARDTL
jgi:shikimate kinase